MDSTSVKDIHFDLVELCKKGDSKAQYRLYNLYKKAMFNVALRMVADDDEAHDVLQESFVSAFQNLHLFEGRSTFGAWLKRIVVNKALSHLKSKKGIERWDEQTDVADSDEESCIGEADYQIEKIKQAMTKLADGFRTVLSLYLFEGYDHKEIAAIMGISESTSKSQYLRAKNKLTHLLKTTNGHG